MADWFRVNFQNNLFLIEIIFINRRYSLKISGRQGNNCEQGKCQVYSWNVANNYNNPSHLFNYQAYNKIYSIMFTACKYLCFYCVE